MGSKTEIEATDAQGSSGGNEVQTVTLSNATGGTFRLAFEGYVTTPLAYNATAAQVDAALDALNSVDNVTVTGNAGGPWTVTFGGSQAGLNVSRMGGDATAATTGTLVRTLSYTYDAASQLTAASDPDSSYAISYDNLGRVLTVDNNGTSGVPRVILTSAYDVVGNRTSLSASVAGTADFLNTYTHDALDRLTRVDQTGQTGGNTVSEKRVDLAYNAIGQYTSIARYKDTDGGTAHEVATAGYSYDTLGRLTGLAYTKGGSNLFTPYSWTYDSLSSGGMGFDGSATVSDPRVAATAAAAVFDALGRITQMVSQDGTSTYGYDSKSQLTSADHSYQSDETYTFDNNGNRTMSGYQTGTDNRLTNDGTYSYTYDAEGNRLTRTKTATGEVTEYTWDYHNRLTKVTEKNSQGTVTQVVEYIYDVFNRRIGRKIDTSAPFDMANAVIERYVLDDIHNGLTSADGGNVVLDFVDTGRQRGPGHRHVEAVPVRRGGRSALRPGRSVEDARRHQSQPVAIGGSSGHSPRPGQAGRHDRGSLQVRLLRQRHEWRHLEDPLPLHQPRIRHGHQTPVQSRSLLRCRRRPLDQRGSARLRGGRCECGEVCGEWIATGDMRSSRIVLGGTVGDRPRERWLVVGQGIVNIGNGVQDVVIGIGNLPAMGVNGIAYVEEKVGSMTL